MNDFRSYFGCRHPIVCAAMNQVSNARLAIAVHEAGAFPSLSVANYFREHRLDREAYLRELTQFKDATGSNGLLLSVGSRALLLDAVVHPFLDFGFRHFELFHWAQAEPDWPRVLARSRELERSHGAKFMFKISSGHLRPGLDYATLVLKGPEGAGRSAIDSPSLPEAFEFCRRELPTAAVVVSGGIHGPEQLHDYLDRGALAVAVGTLFAAAQESAVDDSVKRKIVAASTAELRRVGANGLKGLFASVASKDNSNLTRTLARGVHSADQGGIFVGDAIDHVTEIVPVRRIVERLVGTAA